MVPAGLPAGCTTSRLADGITRFSNDTILVYVKPIRGFYDTEHTPLVCWRGSGYTFESVWEEQEAGRRWYAGILQKGDERLYTAWWYDNGQTRTVSQAHWRSLDLAGAPGFSLVSVTAAEKGVLGRQVRKMLFRN